MYKIFKKYVCPKTVNIKKNRNKNRKNPKTAQL